MALELDGCELADGLVRCKKGIEERPNAGAATVVTKMRDEKEEAQLVLTINMPKPFQLDRRTLLKSLAFMGLASTCAFAADEQLHQPLTPWTPGHFDIHHIDTARGNSTLLIFPDGTTLLIDAGDVLDAKPETLVPPRPNASTPTGEVIATYIEQHAPARKLDYFLATHIHPDHVASLPTVAKHVPIDCVIDRSFPTYAPGKEPIKAPWADAYLGLLRTRQTNGQRVEAVKVGSTTQITTRRPTPSFTVRVLAANGDVWNAQTKTVDRMPATAKAAENNFSIALHLRYGAFTYFTGGDLNFDTHDGREPALDIESPVVRSAGRVEVAVADHHGYFDACGTNFTNTLDAQAYVLPSWDIGHPGSAQMQRMLGAWDGKAAHDVFALELHPANALMNRRFATQLKSQTGHVIVRVAPGGGTFTIYTLDSTDERGTIKSITGPYTSRS